MKRLSLLLLLFLTACQPARRMPRIGPGPQGTTNPARYGAMYSTDGSGNPGTWNAMTGTGQAYIGSVTPAGLMVSTDGSGNPGTWVAVTQSSFGGGGGTGSPGQFAVYGAGNALAGTADLTDTGGVIKANSALFAKQLGPILDATQFPGSDQSIQIANCMVALYAISNYSGTCVANFPSTGVSQTWSVNPFGYAGTPGANIPWTGTLMLCGSGIINLNVPIVMAQNWRLQTCGTGLAAAGNSIHFRANTGVFQSTYNTGTVTMGTPGRQEIITGVGTAFSAASMIGCAFVSPFDQPTAANSTYGIISAVSSATSLTLGWGLNNGTGAPAGSDFAIYCAMIVQGDGNLSGSPVTYTGDISGMQLDCNNIAGCIGLQNWFAEEGSSASNIEFKNYTNIGFDRESNYAQQSGPYSNFIFFPGSSCTAATISYVSRAGAVAMKPLQNSSLNNPSCATLLTQAADIHSGGEDLENLHIEKAVTGIQVGGTVSCPVACPIPPSAVTGVFLKGINAAVNGTNVIGLSNAAGTLNDVTILNATISGGASWTNILSDLQNSCTDTNSKLGAYALTNTGTVALSTSNIVGCRASPGLATTQILAQGTANSTPTNFNSNYLQWFGSYWNGSSASNEQDGCQVVVSSGSGNPTTKMNCAQIAGSTGFQGWRFDKTLQFATTYSNATTQLYACASGVVGAVATVADASALTPGTAYSVSAGAGTMVTHVQCSYNGSVYAWQTM